MADGRKAGFDPHGGIKIGKIEVTKDMNVNDQLNCFLDPEPGPKTNSRIQSRSGWIGMHACAHRSGRIRQCITSGRMRRRADLRNKKMQVRLCMRSCRWASYRQPKAKEI